MYGPVVLSGAYGSDPGSLTPQLEMASIRRTAAQPMTFEGVAGHKPVKLIPIGRVAHEYYTTYFQMVRQTSSPIRARRVPRPGG